MSSIPHRVPGEAQGVLLLLSASDPVSVGLASERVLDEPWPGLPAFHSPGLRVLICEMTFLAPVPRPPSS